jgi:hypothetical protein
MLFTDLLRLTVLLLGGMATALGAVGALAAAQQDEAATIILAAAWWPIAFVAGLLLGRPERAADGVARVLAGARTSTSLPDTSPARIALGRLWPLAALALVAAGVTWIWPQVAVIGAGYALLVALAWRSREAAVTGIEDADGVRFYVEPSPAFEPLRLVRTPGLTRDRMPPGHPPPPPPAG